jgi:nitroreductase
MNREPAGSDTRDGASMPGEPDPHAVETWGFAQSLVHSRRNVTPRRLAAPGPDAAQLQALLALASAAPDHGRLTPWRFVIVPQEQRHRLGEVFALALSDRDPQASDAQIASAREKAFRAPLLMVAVACLGPREPDTPSLERMVSLGAAIQNLLLGAHALAFGAGLTSGKAMASSRLRALLALTDHEVAVCCINIGTVTRNKPREGPRPGPAAFVTTLGAA